MAGVSCATLIPPSIYFFLMPFPDQLGPELRAFVLPTRLLLAQVTARQTHENIFQAGLSRGQML